jgi:uracil-DNA glycosylase
MSCDKSIDLDDLCRRLCGRGSSDTVRNPYAVPGVIENLHGYFGYLLKCRLPLLLVGEAPGHLGCGITGIPFTSGGIIRRGKHRIWKKLAPAIVLPEVSDEVSASVVWDVLDSVELLPVMWNAFPFHPHTQGDIRSNRKPNASEMSEGIGFLRDVGHLFHPEKVIGVGRIGETALRKVFPVNEIRYIRHPARGGAAKFRTGLSEALKEFSKT